MDVSFIIVSYNTQGLLRDCLQSIRKQTKGVEYEVIVVDNDSSDGSPEMVEREFPEMKVIRSGGNLGFGRANNIGMEQARGKYLFLLNSDTLLLNDAASEFFRCAERLELEGRKIGVLGAILKDKDRQPCHSFGRFISPASELREVMAKYLRFLKDEENTSPKMISGVREVDYVTGADMFIPRSAAQLTGGFDPDFFMYCEEVDWQKRMDRAGLKRLIVEGPEIIHLEGGSEKEGKKIWSPRRLANLYNSRAIYRKKHYNRGILPLFRLAMWILDMPSLILLAIMTRQKDYLHLINLK